MSILFSHFVGSNNQISPQECAFTEVLTSIALVPRMLYFYGKMPEKRLKTVAIVGTRKPTKYGENIAFDLARAVAERGGVVVSGLAFGIDAAAHRGALAGGGITIGVLGTAIDQIYPRAHEGLARQIVEQSGVIMSEVPPGTRFSWRHEAKKCFLTRNRLIAGLADVTVVVEAAERSGSLNTAAHALGQGREVLAVPGDISRPMSMGCNALIKTCAAGVYTGVNDVLELLFPEARLGGAGLVETGDVGIGGASTGVAKSLDASDMDTGDMDTAELTVARLIANGVEQGEEIMARTGISVAELNQALTLLEIKGRIRSLGMNRWALV